MGLFSSADLSRVFSSDIRWRLTTFRSSINCRSAQQRGHTKLMMNFTVFKTTGFISHLTCYCAKKEEKRKKVSWKGISSGFEKLYINFNLKTSPLVMCASLFCFGYCEFRSNKIQGLSHLHCTSFWNINLSLAALTLVCAQESYASCFFYTSSNNGKFQNSLPTRSAQHNEIFVPVYVLCPHNLVRRHHVPSLLFLPSDLSLFLGHHCSLCIQHVTHLLRFFRNPGCLVLVLPRHLFLQTFPKPLSVNTSRWRENDIIHAPNRDPGFRQGAAAIHEYS